ncbi:MAG: lipopolysaccharide kinase InaA family protein [Gammaproteobacteria bacterium]
MTWRNQLSSLQHTYWQPGVLQLPDNAGNFIVKQRLRVLPGQRLVLGGEWQNVAGTSATAIMKYYLHDKRAEVHCKREVQGLALLHAANIPAPLVLYCDEKHHYCLLEYLPQARNLVEVMTQLHHEDLTAVSKVLLQLTDLLAYMHDAGICQRDVQPANFVWSRDQWHVVDGGGIVTCRNNQQLLANFALFLVQFGLRYQAIFQQLYDRYQQQRPTVKLPSMEFFREDIFNQYHKRRRHFLRKTLRQCTAFTRDKTLRQLRLYKSDISPSVIANCVENPQHLFNQPAEELHYLKQGNTSTIVATRIETHDLVIKRYNIKNWRHALTRCLRPSRALNAWRSALWLENCGIATAKPIAMIEQRYGSLRGPAYFVSEYVPGQRLIEYMHDGKLLHQQIIANKVIALLRRLYQEQIVHGDLKASNFIVYQEQPYIVDLDSLYVERDARRLRLAFKKDIRRFLDNWQNMPHVLALFSALKEMI